MVLNCVAYNCNNIHDINKAIPFHTFPFKRPDTLKLWIRAIRREHWNPSKTSRLCEEHFLPTDYQDIPSGSKRKVLKLDAVPSVFNFSKHLKNVTKRRKEPTQRTTTGDSEPMEVDLNLTSTVPKTFVDREAQTVENYSTISVLKRKVKTLQQKIKRRDVKILNMKDVIREILKRGYSNAKLDAVLKNYFEVLLNNVPPKKEPELAATVSGNGGAGDDYACNIGTDINDYCDYGSPKEDLESKVIDVYRHPVKEEPEPELGGGDGDAVVVNGRYDCDPPKEEPELVATSDDGDAGSRDVGYDCSHCGISLSTREFKVEHELRCQIQIQRKEFESQITEVYHCGYCRCPFVNREFKERHQRRWCPKRPVAKKKPSDGPYFGCDKCKFVTKWKRSLQKHHLKHNKDNSEWFACTQCSYKTVRKDSMTTHTQIHSNTFDCCCPFCGKSFRTKQSLDGHLLKRHSDESDEFSKLITSKVYTCDICDRYRTTRKAEFNEHLAGKHLKGVGSQKYECPRCPYSSFRKYSLKSHSKTHVERKDYRCAVCKKQFAAKRQLNSHILYIHADNVDLVKTITSKVHRCESCSFKTVIKTHLKSHVRSKHI